jgi:hypothetical protein
MPQRDRLKSFWNVLIEWLIETSCLRLFLLINCLGALLLLFLLALDNLSLFALIAIIVVFSGIPFHSLMLGDCESWKEYLRDRLGSGLGSKDNK